MSGKNEYISFLKRNKKKVAVLAALMLCLGGFLAFESRGSDETTSGDIPLHDGDVLVDSVEVKDGGGDSALVASDEVAESENDDSYFQEMRASLDMDRNNIISMLTEAEEDSSDKDDKNEATAQKMRLLDYMEKEKTIETLIENKGLPECFVVLSDSGANVTVHTEELDQDTVTKICEIVMRQAGVKASEIVVQGTK